MSKFTKQMITFAVLAAAIGGLAWAHFGLGARQEYDMAITAAEEEASAAALAAASAMHMVDQSENDLMRATFAAADGSGFTIEAAEVAGAAGEAGADGAAVAGTAGAAGEAITPIYWVYAGEGDLEFDRFAMRELARTFSTLTASDTVLDSVDDPSEFGIGSVIISGYFRDGTQTTISLGTITPDWSHFYAMVDDDPALYLINATVGRILSQNIEDLIAMGLPGVNQMALTYLYIHERGRPPMEFAFTGTDAALEESLDLFGSLRMEMTLPYPGREFNSAGFEMMVMEDFGSFVPVGIAELFPEDLAAFGMENPILEFIMTDADGNGFHLKFGSDSNDSNGSNDSNDSNDSNKEQLIYVMYAGRPHVFLAERKYAEMLMGLNPFNFIDRFIFITDIDGLDRVVIEGVGGNFEIILSDLEAPTVNGLEVDGRALRRFYQTLISLLIEHDIGVIEEPGTSDITITYHFSDPQEPPAVIELFAYDMGFFAARLVPEPLQFVVSRLAVDVIFSSIEALMAGENGDI